MQTAESARRELEDFARVLTEYGSWVADTKAVAQVDVSDRRQLLASLEVLRERFAAVERTHHSTKPAPIRFAAAAAEGACHDLVPRLVAGFLRDQLASRGHSISTGWLNYAAARRLEHEGVAAGQLSGLTEAERWHRLSAVGSPAHADYLDRVARVAPDTSVEELKRLYVAAECARLVPTLWEIGLAATLTKLRSTDPVLYDTYHVVRDVYWARREPLSAQEAMALAVAARLETIPELPVDLRASSELADAPTPVPVSQWRKTAAPPAVTDSSRASR